MEELQNKIQHLKSLKNEIEECINNEDYGTAQKLLNQYEKKVPFDVSVCTIKAAMYIASNDFNKAREVLLIGLSEFEFNYEINFNLGIVYQIEGEVIKCLEFYFEALHYADNEKEKENAIDAIESLINIVIEQYPEKGVEIKNKIEELNNKLKELDPRAFPLDSNGQSLIGKFITQNEEGGHYVNMYKSVMFTNVNPQVEKLFKTETLCGKIVEQDIEVEVEENTVIPVSVKNSSTTVTFAINDKEYKIKNLHPNSFYYFPIKEKGILNIKGNYPFFMGNPIELKGNKSKPKLVLYLFVDGLSQETLKGSKFQSLMPKTYSFFDNGVRFNECYCNAEWTLPSVPTFFTGKYTVNHKLFHPNFINSMGKKEKLITDIFKENDYLVTEICNDWRQTPLYGYVQGTDRIVYQPLVEGMECEEVIMETIEHLEAFGSKNNFMWLTLCDLHKVPDNLEPKISSQIKNSLFSRTVKQDSNETVFKDFDEKKIERYETEIEKLDFYLGILYEYINNTYAQDEVLVLMVSDHGQTFLKKDIGFSHEGRTKVPLLIKGKGIEKAEIDEIIENVDILPMVLKLSNIECDLNIDGRLPKYLGGISEREYGYTESIFPGQTYKAIINDFVHRFVFESSTFVENDGRVDIDGFTINLINKQSGKEEAKVYSEKIQKYLNVVFEHIKKNIKI